MNYSWKKFADKINQISAQFGGDDEENDFSKPPVPGIRPLPNPDPIDDTQCRPPEKVCPGAVNRCFNPAEGGSHSRFSFFVSGFTGFYDEIRQRTRVEGVLLTVFGDQYGADTQGGGGPCDDCPYPGHKIKFSLRANKGKYNHEGSITPAGPSLLRGGQKHLILIPPGNPLYIKDAGCLGYGCSQSFDAELHLGYSRFDNTGNHRNPPAVCAVDFNIFAADQSYVFGQSPSMPQLQGNNIAIFDSQLCQNEGCPAGVISQQIPPSLDTPGLMASIAIGFNTWSKPGCPC